MAECDTTVSLIYETENIGASLTKINDNFSALSTLSCDIETQLNKEINVRTFFYYGPNSATDSTSNMQNGIASKPSQITIESFVNDLDKLNMPSMSFTGDVAYVVYQKTGWQTQTVTTLRSGSGTVPYSVTVSVPVQRKIGIGRYVTNWVQQTQTFYAGYSWSTTINDTYKFHSPTFIIYRLTYNGTRYNLDTGYPRYTRAITNSTINWNNPATWSIY
jgi:hypothetical protein